jgi:hypothetical protein
VYFIKNHLLLLPGGPAANMFGIIRRRKLFVKILKPVIVPAEARNTQERPAGEIEMDLRQGDK